MDELSKEYVISLYNNALQLHGDRPEAVRWTSAGQAEHYMQSRLLNMKMKSDRGSVNHE
jgi:hypothetical protein